ncbi:MAG: hypothetical protein ACRDRO_21700 [Pseudonocardiaceae bacterium]
MRERWFPADVKFPDQIWPWQRTYVIAADDGLHVFTEPGDTARWHAVIDWAVTVLPADKRAARNGLDIHTDRGLVVLTLGGGCHCGVLGHWRGPTWSLS